MTPDNTLLAGTSHGVFRLANGAWMSAAFTAASSKASATKKRPVTATRTAAAHTTMARKGAKAHAAAVPRKSEPVAAPQLGDALVYALTSGSAGVYAGTSAGVWHSADSGQSLSQLQLPQLTEARYIATHGQMVVAASLTGAALSANGGTSWTSVMPPATLTQVGALAIDGVGNLWVGGPEGVFYSTDRGVSWKTLRNLFVRQVDGIFYDAANNRVLVSSTGGTVGFAASLPSYAISYWDTGWPLRFLRPVGDHLIGATLYDGIVVEPKMVASPFPTASSSSAETARAR
jgi:ligand-binding sensor domain-containing protein